MEFEKLKNKQVVFIIGMARSGTTLLSKALSTHPEVAGIGSELTVFNRYIHPLVNGYEIELGPIYKGLNYGLPAIWSREKLDSFICHFIEEIYLSMNIRPEHKVILDKFPNYSFMVDLIHYYIPNAKFIHLIRDGRDAAYSWNAVWYKTGWGNPDFVGACLDWVKYKNAAKGAKVFNGSYYELRYEDLLRNPEKELTNLCEFCNIDSAPETIHNIVKQNMGEANMVSYPDKSVSYSERVMSDTLWKKRLTKYQIFLAKRYLKKELIVEGYEKSENWGVGPVYTFFYTIRFYVSRIYSETLKSAKELIKKLIAIK